MLPVKIPFIPPVESLETSRLIIRIDAEEQYVQKFKRFSNDELKAHFGITSDKDLEVQKGKVNGGLSTYRTSVVFFHIVERSAGRVLGSCAFHNWYAIHRRTEIGYALAEEYRNQGYMREALPLILDFGFDEMSLNRIEAFIGPDNKASQRVVERAGFQLEGCLKEHFCYEGITGDSLVYGLLQRDYSKAII
jgi:ribosomal-protein-alanine N-acetyltransferase